MSYGLYVGKAHSATGHAWLAGYGDEPSSHWLEIIERHTHAPDTRIRVGVTAAADLPGQLSDIPQVSETARHIRVSYSYFKGVPAPITNGGLNEFGVAVRDIWSPSRPELIAMTPANQSGPNYSDLARIVLERAKTARAGVVLIGELIAAYGESTYGGNSHIIADANEAWVMIQFAGGQGLWVAERLGPDSIRASRPGYIQTVPVESPEHPDFLYSDNLLAFAKAQGWYSAGRFDVNTIYGDGAGRWDGVAWIEAEMARRAALPGKIGLSDMIWAVRTSKLTGDTAGYGQVVPLLEPQDQAGRMLWHAPIGASAAPFAPVFMLQHHLPEEFGPHRYLTHGEAHRFMDACKAITDGEDTVSRVLQRFESTRSAVYECKRLLYLMLQDKDHFTPEVIETFVQREASLAVLSGEIMAAARVLHKRGEVSLAATILQYFSQSELLAGLDLVTVLAASIEARLKVSGMMGSGDKPIGYDQIW